jgi:hypothetical protein
MTSHETAIAERLRAAADRIQVDADPARLTDAGPATGVGGRPPARRRRVLAGLAVAVSVAAVVAAVRLVPDGGGTAQTDLSNTAATSPVGGVTEPAFAAHIESPPDWFGEPTGGYRNSGYRTGRWVSMAIGRESADRIAEPIVVSVFDGRYLVLDGAETVTIDGTPRRSVRQDDWQALATDGTPTVVVSGSVDEATLAAVLDAAEVTDPSGDFSLRLRDRPDGYSEVVSPRVLGPDPPLRPVLAGGSRYYGINEVSDWTGPLLDAVWSGADVTAIDIDGATGWTGLATANPLGPLRLLVWSPRPGVVFEITTDDMERPEADLVELAEATSAIGFDEWERLYDP